jgi:dipeptidyl aminopeptidase/acylaminoacyl peptidase
VASLEGDGGWPGCSSQVQAVCDWFGPTDFLRMDRAGSEIWHDGPASPESRLVGAPIQSNPDLAARANPISYVDGDEPPFLIVHGGKDPLVPLEQSQLLYQALSAAGGEATFKALLDAGHGGPQFEEPAVQRLVCEFFEQSLR